MPLSTFLCITFYILSMSAYIGTNFCISLPVLIRLVFGMFGILHLLGNGEFSSKLVLSSRLMSIFSEMDETGIRTGLEGGLSIGSR